jgi:uncharacterized RDD family membrane protein YckC
MRSDLAYEKRAISPAREVRTLGHPAMMGCGFNIMPARPAQLTDSRRRLISKDSFPPLRGMSAAEVPSEHLPRERDLRPARATPSVEHSQWFFCTNQNSREALLAQKRCAIRRYADRDFERGRKRVTNPYQPPRAVVHQPTVFDPKSTYLANAKKRFANLIVDWFFAMIYVLLTGFFLGLMGFGPWLENMGKFEERLLTTALFFLYYLTFEGAFGWTFGKLITKTRVVDESGAKPKFTKLLGRNLVRFIPFEPFSFLGQNAVGWHDKWSGTRVISLKHSQGHTLAESFATDFGEESQDQKPEGWETMSEAQKAIWEMRQQKVK